MIEEQLGILPTKSVQIPAEVFRTEAKTQLEREDVNALVETGFAEITGLITMIFI